MRKSISKRLKITKSGKVIRRARGLGHSRANKLTGERLRRKGIRTLALPASLVRKHFS